MALFLQYVTPGKRKSDEINNRSTHLPVGAFHGSAKDSQDPYGSPNDVKAEDHAGGRL